ncbi:phosphoribosylaminoimidazole-succinocarboxamide synthase [Marininema mesophilum]|uniref:Phosphoribosylaminoimidazole-succinocarboxamide synthase n=1 Tax=Marininema mesophilum TaxID=1048340 RepID=A0A1H2YVI6_9BACL|nr:phosphoribosylaminoimidazolesuccinocarboxamide synthase [Marininema mesophilum]SDX09190.1 phosphoribosylaminoimidazole-succinocarboxamide synthase [Marininema mesophilum]
MKRGELLYEGKAKKIYLTDNPQQVWVAYKDDATAYNAQKRGSIQDKGKWNNRISARLFQFLGEKGVEHHFLKEISATEQLVRRVTIIPLEVLVRNISAGTLANRLGIEEGRRFARPVVEICYKNDELGDPLITEDHIAAIELATDEQVTQMKEIALKVNELLSEQMDRCGITLVDFKLEFGIDGDGRLLLADEISPDTCRFWDKESGKRLDKDRFRRDLGDVEEAYHEIWSRLGGETHV